MDFLIYLCLWTLILLMGFASGFLLSPKRKTVVRVKEIKVLGSDNFQSVYYDGSNMSELLTFGNGAFVVGKNSQLVNERTKQSIPSNRWILVRKEDKKVFILTSEQMGLFY